MFKPSAPLLGRARRMPLSTKQAGREFYKGNRVGCMGTVDRYGRFTPDWSKIRTYVYPQNARNSFLTPFVAANIEKTRLVDINDVYENYPKRFTGEEYLRNWKIAGGHDVVDEQPKVVQEETAQETKERKRRENMPPVADVRPTRRSQWKGEAT